MNDEHERRMRAASQSEGSLSPMQTNRWTNSTQGSTESAQSPPMRSHSGFVRNHENSTPPQGHISRAPFGPLVTGHLSPRPDMRSESRAASALGRDRDNSLVGQPGYPPRTTSVTNQNSSSYVLSSRRPSTESINSSVFDVVESLSPTDTNPSMAHRQSVQSAHSATPTAPYQAAAPPRYPGPPPLYQTPVTARRTSGITIRSQSSGGRTAHAGVSLRGVDEGLIPVDMESSLTNEVLIRPREPDCAITPASSFYKCKGFCKGAEEAQRGQLGFKRIKRPVGVSYEIMITFLATRV